MIKGLYVHIPFCNHICGYCDFAKFAYENSRADKYLKALQRDVDAIEQNSFESIYIGGGTPTSLSEKQLEELLKMLSRFDVQIEYTIEINPENFTLEKGKLLKQYGINRVSIGIQSFDEALLQHMHRAHRNEDVVRTMQILDEVGINNRSIDLIYGFNRQSLGDVIKDLQKAVELNVTHISIYGLEIYPKTLFGLQNYHKVSDELDYLMYASIREFLNEHAYQQYETSNFALGPYRSHHNQLYWKYEDFLGIGLGASSKIGDRRLDNTRNFIDYLNGKNLQETIRLSLDDQRFEAIMMNLRLLDGIDIAEYNRRFECNLLKKYADAIDKNINKGLLQIENNFLKVTEKGIFVLNDILVDFMDD